MTSNIDDRKLCATKDAGQTDQNHGSARSADLEKILNSLGHVVADSQQKSDDTLKEIGERAQEIQTLAADANANVANDAADIFGALEDQMSELAAKVEQVPDSQGDADVDAVVDAGAGANVVVDAVAGDTALEVDEAENLPLDWDQSTADELAQIYAEIDAGFGTDLQADEGEVTPEQIAVDSEQMDPEHDENALDLEDEHDQKFGAVADAASAPVSPPDLSVDANEVDVEADVESDISELKISEPKISEPKADLMAPVAQGEEPSVEVIETSDYGLVGDSDGDEPVVGGGGGLEFRFAEIALRIEDMLGHDVENAALKSMESRFDHIEAKLNILIDHPENDTALHVLEAQMGELKEQFQLVETQISRIAMVEENLNELIDDVKNSTGEIKTVVAGMSGVIAGGLPAELGGSDRNDRLAELGDILENYISERRQNDEIAADAFSNLQLGLNDIADYLIANDAVLSGQVDNSENALVAQYADEPLPDFTDAPLTDVTDAPLTEFESGEASQPEVFVEPDVDLPTPHGAAQYDFAVQQNQEEIIDQYVNQNDGGLADQSAPDQGSSYDLALAAARSDENTISTESEISADASDADAQNNDDVVDAVKADGEIDVAATPGVGEGAIDNAAEEAVQVQPEITQASPVEPVEQFEVRQNNPMVEAAREAAARASSEGQNSNAPDHVDKAVKAGNFLATARQAALEAAARAETERVDAAEKKGKKKRGLFSFTRGGASPVLILATTMLTATTGGLIYSQIKDHPAIERVALNDTVSGVLEEIGKAADAKIVLNKSVLIGDVPHRRSGPADGFDVPVGIVVETPDVMPGFMELAEQKRRETLAEMSAALTSGKSTLDAGVALPKLPVINVSISADEVVARPTTGSGRNNGPTLALPPASVGPFSLRVAAAKGDAGSQFEVATRYAQGRGVKRDYSKAAKWYGRAAGQGHAIAQYRLAALYEKGQGVAKDSARANSWYRSAAEKGNVKAMHNLAVLYTGRNGSRPDYSTAAHWFMAAAEHGLADSQFNLGILYANGLGVKRDKIQSYKWFSLASARGDDEAAKRQIALKSAMSPGQIKSAEKLVKSWNDKPVKSTANNVHRAAALLKKSDNKISRNTAKLVAQAQGMLNKLGYGVGMADGQMGPITRNAISNFQKRSGMKVTGKVSPGLISRLSGLAG